MHLPSYPILAISNSHAVYRFLSTGPNGEIPKLIIFSEYRIEDKVYNLALVDIINKGLSDMHLSNNRDIYKILATVAKVAMDYAAFFPERTIYFAGSDEEGKRIAVYNAAIRKYYHILEGDFIIEGYIDDLVKEMYNPLKNYLAFLVKRK